MTLTYMKKTLLLALLAVVVQGAQAGEAAQALTLGQHALAPAMGTVDQARASLFYRNFRNDLTGSFLVEVQKGIRGLPTSRRTS